MIETWKRVPLLSIFEASSLGRIRVSERPQMRCSKYGKIHSVPLPAYLPVPQMDRAGYLIVRVMQNRKRKTYYVHRLVGLTYVDGYESGLCINHKNGIKTDNLPNNLEWVSLSENSAHQWRSGLATSFGEGHARAKLNEQDVRRIRSGYYGNKSQYKIAKELNVSQALIFAIMHNIVWKHLTNT